MGKARHAGPGGIGELRQSVKVGKLNLVDLAGSERVHITGATGHFTPFSSLASHSPLLFKNKDLPWPHFPLSFFKTKNVLVILATHLVAKLRDTGYALVSSAWAQVKLAQMSRSYKSSMCVQNLVDSFAA